MLATKDINFGKNKTKKTKLAQWNKGSTLADKPSEEEYLATDGSEDHNIGRNQEGSSGVTLTPNHDIQQDNFNEDTGDPKHNNTHGTAYKTEQTATERTREIITTTLTLRVETSETRDTLTEEMKTRKGIPTGKTAIKQIIVTARRIKTKDPMKNEKPTTMSNDKETTARTEIISTISRNKKTR